mmetsp:Transcript_37394/g.119952  ORF Transcript_37394/g.119952 Transcript_37394/m.119952 type:complete len:84 (-) Transcript_37394:118-369(-)
MTIYISPGRSCDERHHQPRERTKHLSLALFWYQVKTIILSPPNKNKNKNKDATKQANKRTGCFLLHYSFIHSSSQNLLWPTLL